MQDPNYRTIPVYMTDLQDCLWGLALAEDMSEVDGELLVLARILGLPEPVWSDEKERYVWEWEDYS